MCSTFGISGSIYYLWFHFICVTPSFLCIRRTTSFALMSEAEISWLCSGDVKNLWTGTKIKIMSRLAQSGQWDKLKSETKCLWKHMLWIMIYLFDLCAPNNKKADTIMTLKGYCTSLKNENSGIIYVPSRHSKEVWLSSSNFGPYNKTQYSIGPHWLSWNKCISSNWITIHKHVYYTVFRDIRMFSSQNLSF